MSTAVSHYDVLLNPKGFVSGAKDVVVNPKVNNMLNAYENAKYPLFLISDVSIKGLCQLSLSL